MASSPSSGRWVAIVTAVLSVLIGLLYLILITVLDARGPMRPPPLEALGVAVAVAASHAEEVPPPFVGLSPENVPVKNLVG
jgi:hypothetical protein